MMRETTFNPDGTVSHTTDDGVPDEFSERAAALAAVESAETFADLRAATAAIGTATAGTSPDASRADHTHALPVPGSGLYVSGGYYHMPCMKNGTRSIPPGEVHFFPIRPDGPVTIDALGIDVTTGGSSGVAHLYLVGSSATTGRPTTSSPILGTAANVAVATSGSFVAAVLAAPYAATRGVQLWGAIHAIVGTATYRAVDPAFQMGPPLQSGSASSSNGSSMIVATGGGTSTTPLADLSGLTIATTDTSQGAVVAWRSA